MPKRPLATAVVLVGLTLLAPASASALPDAELVRISADGGGFTEGDLVPLHIVVRSAGDDPLPAIPVSLTVDNDHYAEWKTPADLPPGETATWSLTWRATGGAFPFIATVDPLNELLESNEVNNSTFINIGAARLPEPSDWPAFLVGILSFLVAAGVGHLFRRRFPSLLRGRKRASRFARRSSRDEQ